jgi:hypothetical protein
VVGRISCMAAMVVDDVDVIELRRWWGDMIVWQRWVGVAFGPVVALASAPVGEGC